MATSNIILSKQSEVVQLITALDFNPCQLLVQVEPSASWVGNYNFFRRLNGATGSYQAQFTNISTGQITSGAIANSPAIYIMDCDASLVFVSSSMTTSGSLNLTVSLIRY